MKVLFLSNLYPNLREPEKAVFNRQTVEQLKKFCEIIVVAPIPWFPLKRDIDRKNIPFSEEIGGLKVYHPLVFYIPKFFRAAYGLFFYLSIRSFIRDLDKKCRFDVIFATWVYPDGFAAMRIARMIDKPFFIKAHGSDINLYCKTIFRRKLITKVLRQAKGIIAVSKDLKKRISEFGIPGDKISVIYSGIDHDIFFPADKLAAREKLGIKHKGKIILFIGHLIKTKGVVFLLQALALLNRGDFKLYVIGVGSSRWFLQRSVTIMGLEENVAMIGSRPHNEIPSWMNASDVLCLPSLAEGVPNVILEAFGCGIPVVASSVGGIPEILIDSNMGGLVKPMDARSLAGELDRVCSKKWDRTYIHKYALNFSWEKTARSIFECLNAGRLNNEHI